MGIQVIGTQGAKLWPFKGATLGVTYLEYFSWHIVSLFAILLINPVLGHHPFLAYFITQSTKCVEAEHKIKWELLTYLFNLRFRAQLNVVLAGVLEATSLFSTIGHRALQLRY